MCVCLISDVFLFKDEISLSTILARRLSRFLIGMGIRLSKAQIVSSLF